MIPGQSGVQRDGGEHKVEKSRRARCLERGQRLLPQETPRSAGVPLPSGTETMKRMEGP